MISVEGEEAAVWYRRTVSPIKRWHSARRTRVSLRAPLLGLAEALGFPLSPLISYGPLTTGISLGHTLHCLPLHLLSQDLNQFFCI